MLTRLLAGALLAASAAAPAAHAESCYGTAMTTYVCVAPENVHVSPTGGPPAGDCFYVNSDTCTPVFVPTPSVTTSGPVARTCHFC